MRRNAVAVAWVSFVLLAALVIGCPDQSRQPDIGWYSWLGIVPLVALLVATSVTAVPERPWLGTQILTGLAVLGLLGTLAVKVGVKAAEQLW